MVDRVNDYHDDNRQFQDRLDTRRIADQIASRTRDHIDEPARTFTEHADVFFLATCDHQGLPARSYKGGDPGFVRAVDSHGLAFPNYDGNGKYQSMDNLLKNPYAGVLFIDFEQQRRLRVQGIASIADEDPLVAVYPKYQRVSRRNTCPRQAVSHISAWKLRDDINPILPAHDPARQSV